MTPLIPIALGGLGLLLLSGGKKAGASSSSSAAHPSSSGKTAQDFQLRIAEALSRGDVNALMGIANEMQAAGLVTEAESLRASALTLQSLGALAKPAGGAATSPGLPAVPVGAPVVAPTPAIPSPPVAPPPAIVLPPVVVPSATPLPAGSSVTAEQQRRFGVAQSAAMNLRNTSRYHEDKNLVKAFQAQEGLKTDGLYGPKSALAIADYGIVPPRPRYWTSKTMKADKAEYAKALLVYAQNDPSRAADWTAASKVANDPAQ
jgi:murein L,D-transpeptidase YcbB/YkuD